MTGEMFRFTQQQKDAFEMVVGLIAPSHKLRTLEQ